MIYALSYLIETRELGVVWLLIKANKLANRCSMGISNTVTDGGDIVIKVPMYDDLERM